MKLTITLNRTFAAAAAAIVAVAGAGTAIHSASVKNQICLSYEEQLFDNLNTEADLLTEGVGMLYHINQNPFAGLALLGQAVTYRDKVNHTVKVSNDLRYAYLGTCGKKRAKEWGKGEKVSAITERVDIQRREFGQLLGS